MDPDDPAGPSIMELPNANRSWRPAASPDRPTPARTLIGRRGQRRRSAGFQTCRIADFQIGRVSPWRGVCGFGNPRYSRLGSLRYRIACEMSGFLSQVAPFRALCFRPETGPDARFSVSLNPSKNPLRQPSLTLKFFAAIGRRPYLSKFLPRKYICIA
jgi:hypothetical protein